MTFDDLVVEAARKAGATILIRGLRDGTDFDYEMQMAGMNEAMAPGHPDACFCPPRPRCAPSPPHWCARSPGWAATSPPSCRAGRGAAEEEIQALILTGRSHDPHSRRRRAWYRRARFGAGETPAGLDPQNTLLLDTKDGRVVIKLRPDVAPQACRADQGAGARGLLRHVPFHRVIDGFMAQTGDPTGTGMGGSK